MHPAPLVAGILTLVVVFGDLVWTTLVASGGGGPLTSRLSHRLWQLARPRQQGALGRHRRLRAAGLGVVLLMIATWLTLLWAGWTLVFAAADAAVVEADTGRPVDLSARAYFVGTTLSTLGPGEVVARGWGWRVITAVTAFSGLLFATMAITYLVPVIRAVTQRREVAAHVAALGDSPAAFVCGAWNGRDLRGLEPHLVALTPRLARLGQLHLTYPVLHYFHDMDRGTSAAVQIAVVDEAVTLIDCAVPHDARPRSGVLRGVRGAVDAVMSTLTSDYIDAADGAPPVPSLDPLRKAGIPTVDEASFERALDRLADRRRALSALVADDGWSWDDVAGSSLDKASRT